MTASHRTRLASLLVPPLVWMAVIFVLSGQPSDEVDRAWWDVFARKVAHVTEYAVLTALWWRALRGARRRAGRSPVRSRSHSSTRCRTSSTRPSSTGAQGTPVDVMIDAIGMAIAALAIYARRRSRGPSRPMAA